MHSLKNAITPLLEWKKITFIFLSTSFFFASFFLSTSFSFSFIFLSTCFSFSASPQRLVKECSSSVGALALISTLSWGLVLGISLFSIGFIKIRDTSAPLKKKAWKASRKVYLESSEITWFKRWYGTAVFNRYARH